MNKEVVINNYSAEWMFGMHLNQLFIKGERERKVLSQGGN